MVCRPAPSQQSGNSRRESKATFLDTHREELLNVCIRASIKDQNGRPWPALFREVHLHSSLRGVATSHYRTIRKRVETLDWKVSLQKPEGEMTSDENPIILSIPPQGLCHSSTLAAFLAVLLATPFSSSPIQHKVTTPEQPRQNFPHVEPHRQMCGSHRRIVWCPLFTHTTGRPIMKSLEGVPVPERQEIWTP